MPKYRANESRVKLAWLCRVQPIFNEVNRDGGRQLVNPRELKLQIPADKYLFGYVISSGIDLHKNLNDYCHVGISLK